MSLVIYVYSGVHLKIKREKVGGADLSYGGSNVGRPRGYVLGCLIFFHRQVRLGLHVHRIVSELAVSRFWCGG